MAEETNIPGPASLEWMERRRAAVARGPFHVTPVFIARGEGAWVEDVDGNRYLDLVSGIGVLNLGHGHEGVVAAVREQASCFLHAGFNVTPYALYVRVCEELNRRAPGTFTKKSFLANSGAEAVENAIKIARAHTGKPWVACFDHAFHGRTFFAMALTAKERPYKQGFAPFPAEIVRAPFPYAYRWPGGASAARMVDEAFAAFEAAVEPVLGKLGAVVVEPVLGEGGFIPLPRLFAEKLRAFCDRNGVVLIADEIQCGFGRAGTFFASEALGLVPDLIVTGKALGGGLPLSAVTGHAEIMDAPAEGGIGGTFGGNPLACAAALAVFEAFDRDGVLARAREIEQVVTARMGEWVERFPIVGEARGLGVMRALELVRDGQTRSPFPEAARALVKWAYENGVLLMTAGSYGNVVRLLMPLVIRGEELEQALDVIERGLEEESARLLPLPKGAGYT